MNHDAYEAAQARLNNVRALLAQIAATPVQIGRDYPGQIDRRLLEEEAALEDLLVGEDPLVLAAIDWLREQWADSDLVMRRVLLHTESTGHDLDVDIKLGGNEHWIFADVQVGDDYGVLDFERHHAIFRNTGALYRIESDGTVADDPIFVPVGSRYTGPVETHNTHRRS